MAGEMHASIVVDGVVRIQVRGYSWAGDELMVELEHLAPNVIGLPIRFDDGARVVFEALVKEEREQDGRSVLICELHGRLAGERGAFG